MKAEPFELKKGKTGRYTMRSCDRALALKRTDPAAWLRLPAELRDEAEEAARLEQEYAGKMTAVDPLLIGRELEAGEGVTKTLGQLDPKILTLADSNPKFGDLDFAEVLGAVPVLEIALRNVKVPKKRGRPTEKETLPLVRQVRKLLAQGVPKRQIARRLFQKPGEKLDTAYSRTRAFIKDHKLTSD